MTKEEIKFYKEQQKKIEDGHAYKIKTLQEDIRRRNERIEELSKENEFLKKQITHLQSGLTGEEIDYLKAI